MLQPSRTKFRKAHRGGRFGKATRGHTVVFGEYGLKIMEPCWISARQIEAARRAITRHLRRGGRIWIRVFPSKPVTHKPAETRQGGGKGPVDHWVVVVRPGRVIFEIAGVGEDVAKEALRLASHKLPVESRMVFRGETQPAGVGL